MQTNYLTTEQQDEIFEVLNLDLYVFGNEYNLFEYYPEDDLLEDFCSGDFAGIESTLYDVAWTYINQQEVIYYSVAMTILAEHDSSLSASLELARDMGYTIDSVNSELLATLLLQGELNNELADLVDEVLEELKELRDEIIEEYEEA